MSFAENIATDKALKKNAKCPSFVWRDAKLSSARGPLALSSTCRRVIILQSSKAMGFQGVSGKPAGMRDHHVTRHAWHSGRADGLSKSCNFEDRKLSFTCVPHCNCWASPSLCVAGARLFPIQYMKFGFPLCKCCVLRYFKHPRSAMTSLSVLASAVFLRKFLLGTLRNRKLGAGRVSFCGLLLLHVATPGSLPTL